MKYHVCVQNCLEDYFYENLDSVSFDNVEAAEEYVKKTEFEAFDIGGEIQAYFPDCEIDGDPDKDEEEPSAVIDCYQIINIIPSDKNSESIDECYGNDERSVFSAVRSFTLDNHGDVRWSRRYVH